MGELRICAEAVALVHVLLESPELTAGWTDITEGAGARFHFAVRKPLARALKKYPSLLRAYNDGSDMALHARFSAIARGLVFDGDRGSSPGQTMLGEQEVDAKDARPYFQDVVSVLEVQVECLDALIAGFPECNFATSLPELGVIRTLTREAKHGIRSRTQPMVIEGTRHGQEEIE